MEFKAKSGRRRIGKKILLTCMPTLILYLSVFIVCYLFPYPYNDLPIVLLLAHSLSLAYLIVWIKNNYGSLFYLIISFAAASLPLLIYEYFNGGFLQYVVTMLMGLYFTLPLVLLTIIIAIVEKVRTKGRGITSGWDGEHHEES